MHIKKERILNSRQSLLLLPALIYLLVFYFLPITNIFFKSLSLNDGFSLDNYVRILNVPVYRQVLINTVKIAFSVSFICLILGYPTAYFLLKLPKRIFNVVIIIVIIPFWTSILVRSFAWVVLLQKEGAVNNLLLKLDIISQPIDILYNATGVHLGMVYVLLPYMIIVLYSSMENIDRQQLKVAQSLGANPVSAFIKVFIPYSLNGIYIGFLFVFLLAFGYFITPALLGGRKETMIAMLIDTQMNRMLDWGFGSALSFFLFICIVIILIILSFVVDIESIINKSQQS